MSELDEQGQLVEQNLGPGLGLLKFHTLIDTPQRRLYRLFGAIAEYPELMGLGIDEDTALIVNGEVGRVIGKGIVTFADGRDVRFNRLKEQLEQTTHSIFANASSSHF